MTHLLRDGVDEPVPTRELGGVANGGLRPRVNQGRAVANQQGRQHAWHVGSASVRHNRAVRRSMLPLACALAQALSVVPGGGTEPGAAVSAAASVVGLVTGLLLVRRRRMPLIVLGIAATGYLFQVLLAGAVLPVVVVVAAYGVSRHVLLGDAGRLHRPAGLVLAAACVAVVVGPLLADAELSAQYAVLLLVAVLAGVLAAQRAVRDIETRRALVHAERVRLARDLHDVVGHGMSAITVQAGAARLSVGAGDDRAASEALNGIEAAGRAVLREVRWLVTLLRNDAERPRLAEVTDLVSDARRCGIGVQLDVSGELEGVDGDVGEAAYRLVQEALTNVVRHAPEASVVVTVVVSDDLRLDVVDDGAVSIAASTGNGIRGMQERVTALGGSVDAGPRRDAPGWSVSCRLPRQGVGR
jgi:signal transduction histidine kinase